MLKRVVALFTIACMAITLASCSSSPKSSATSSGSKNVTVWLGSWWKDQVPSIEKNFAQDNPGYTVKIQLEPIDNYLENAVTAIVGGTPPDALDLDTLMIPTPIGQNLLCPLDSMMQQYNLKASDFVSQVYNVGVKGNSVYAIPDRAAPSVLFYNKTMFDKAGVAYPTDSWTKQQLLSAAQKLTIPGKQYGYGIAASNSDPANVMTSFCPILWSSGGDFLNKDMTKATLSTPQGIAGIKYYVDLFRTYKVVPDGTLNYSITKDLLPMLENGTLAMLPIGDSNMNPLIDAFKAHGWQWGTTLEAAGPTREGGWSMTIPSTAKNVAGAEKFIAWFVKPNNISSQNIVMPGVKSAKGQGLWKDPMWNVFWVANDKSQDVPATPKWSQVQNIVVIDLQKALQGSMTPEQAAKDMDSQIDAIL
jgi:multiple sugar transport system substrate-binding protein